MEWQKIEQNMIPKLNSNNGTEIRVVVMARVRVHMLTHNKLWRRRPFDNFFNKPVILLVGKAMVLGIHIEDRGEPSMSMVLMCQIYLIQAGTV